MKSKKKDTTRFPTGLKWVIAYLIYNAFGMVFVFFFGKYLGISYNTTYLLLQLVCYSLLAWGIIRLNNSARIATISFLVLILAIRIYLQNYRAILWSFIFVGLVIHYLTRPEVELLFTKKIYSHR